MELPLKHGSAMQWLRLAPDVRAAILAPPRTAAAADPVAAALAMKQAAVYLVSSIPAELARALGFVPFGGVAAALEAALRAVGPDPFVAVMPEGGSVLPAVSGR